MLVSKKYIQTNKGAVLLTMVVFFLFISLILVLSVSATAIRDVRIVNNLDASTQSLVLSESLLEDLTYRLREGLQVPAVASLVLGTYRADGVISSITSNEVDVITTGNVRDAIRRNRSNLILGDGVTFNFGVQTDVGGFVMENSSSVTGNLFSNGTVVGSGNSIVRGEIISAAVTGLVDGIHATGTVWSNTIENSEIEGDAYYQTITGTTVWGTEYPGSPDQSTSSLPISDETIEEWKAIAQAGGTYIGPCPYEITFDATIGPLYIPCDLDISGNNFTVDIAGHVWVDGNVTTNNGPTLRVDPSLEDSSVAIIADDESNPEHSGYITINNSMTFEDSGTEGSYVLLLSQNSNAELGGSTPAIEIVNSSEGDVLLYAGHGEILIGNNVSLREITAWRVRLQNNAEVIYETGLASLLFTTGPSGGFEIRSWDEIE